MNVNLVSGRDINFLVHEWLRPNERSESGGSPRFDREYAQALFELAEKLAVEAFLPHYKLSDQREPVVSERGVHVLPEIRAALKKYAELGFFGASFPEDIGGIGLPNLASAACLVQFAAANVATAAYAILTVANARLIARFGTAAQVRQFALPQIAGRSFGTMCLSEPQAGSSLADIRARAEWEGNDELGSRYRVFGNKMWISGGDHDAADNIIHLVLAKIPTDDGVLPEGTKGISLFIVPKVLPDGRPNDIHVAGVNHKMGYRGISNCLLNFGEQGGSVGWRIGEPGNGLAQMFRMMNEARIGVGLGAAALGYRGYRLSVQYARERVQGRPVGERGGGPIAIIDHPDVKRMLLSQKAYVEGALALCLYCANLLDEDGNFESEQLLGLLTPVAKSWSSEYGLAANDLAIQIHGGYGYTRDFDLEQLYRDNRLNTIHEGTTGIQAIDLVGRKILRDRGAALEIAKSRAFHTAQLASEVIDLQGVALQLTQAWGWISGAVKALMDLEANVACDNATSFMAGLGHVTIAWLWLDQAIAARRLIYQGAESLDFLNGKINACLFFFEHELPRAELWLRIVASQSMSARSFRAEEL